MSTLAVGTIKSATTSPPTVQNSSGTEIGTFCRAWVNFNGTGTVAIRAAFNVSSITDNGTGDYTANFTNAMADVNYCASGAGSEASGTAANNEAIIFSPQSYKTVSSYRFWNASTNGSGTDGDSICVVVFR